MEISRICEFCDQEISFNYDLHVVRCEREKVNKKNKPQEEVKKEEIKTETCELCQKEFKSSEIDRHRCEAKMVRCNFCDEEVFEVMFRDHRDECGNRTERCPTCREFILRRYYSDHINANNCEFRGPAKTDEELRIEAALYRKKL